MDPETQVATPDTIPANHIDIDSQETQKLLDDAFNSARGKDTPSVEVVPEPKEPAKEAPQVEIDANKDEASTATKVADTTEAKQEDAKSKETPNKDSQELVGIPDWAKDLPREVQEKVLSIAQEAQYHQQRWRSDIGRQSALQNKLTEARRELARLSSQVKRPQEDSDLAAATKGDHSKSLEEWNQIIEADPNLARAIDLRIKAEVNQAKTEIARQVDANIDPLYQHNAQAFVEEQNRILHEAVPNVDEVLQSPVYNYWINNRAAPGIRQLATTSIDASDAINVLRVYAQEASGVFNEMVARGMIPNPQQVSTQSAQPVQQQTTTQVDTSVADKVAKNREQKVHAAPVVPTAPVTAPTTSMATTLANSKPGQSIDLDDEYVQRALETAYNQYKRK